ncbi:hypothetical protein ACFU98_10530 [Streptomyces sp. NPDC057575]|uniref:hypothetical protein n=1 Tax=unclassified Streptomyces TaxID=2593676 RepID=UPI0036947929
MTPQDPGVYISPAQMYEEVRGLSAAVSRIETKIDGILNEAKDIRDDVSDHENRLRALESTVWRAAGGAAVLGAGAGVLAQYLLR